MLMVGFSNVLITSILHIKRYMFEFLSQPLNVTNSWCLHGIARVVLFRLKMWLFKDCIMKSQHYFKHQIWPAIESEILVSVYTANLIEGQNLTLRMCLWQNLIIFLHSLITRNLGRLLSVHILITETNKLFSYFRPELWCVMNLERD